MDFEDNNPLGVSDEEAPRARAAEPPASTSNQRIVISDAGKSHESGQRGHITYTIRLANGTAVRRRYSEFESLRRLLRRFFPCVVVPQIPEKHTLSAYASNPTHAHEDAKVIDHRQRMLAAFLNRCMGIPQIHDSWVLERFLDPNTSWREVLQSEVVQGIPKSPLQAPPVNPSRATPAHAHLPIPPGSAAISGGRGGNASDDDFVLSEAAAREYEHVLGGGLEKRARKINKHYGALAAEYADLGGQFNSFSLDSHGQFEKFAPAVEKVGQAVDQGYISTSQLVDTLSVDFSEPLLETVQMAATARQVLKYRRLRELQVQITRDSLQQQRATLAQLLKAENEAQRINSYLHADDRIAAATQGLKIDDRDHVVDHDGDHDVDHVLDREHGEHGEHAADLHSVGSLETDAGPDTDYPTDARSTSGKWADDDDASDSLSPSLSPPSPSRTSARDDAFSIPETAKPAAAASTTAATAAPVKRGFRLPGLSHINHAIHGMMDVDPQAARRNNITRAQERIQQLEAALAVAEIDARAAAQEVKTEVARYDDRKNEDVKRLVRAFVRCHIEWAEKNLESWLEAKQAIGNP